MKKKLSIFLICFALTVLGMSMMAFADGCLTFTGESEPFTLSKGDISWDGTLEYSTDLSTWTKWDGSDISSAQSAPYVLYLRGKNNTYVSSEYEPATTGLRLSKPASCSGNIMTLLDYTNQDSKVVGKGAFQYLFIRCTNLISAPALPATTLGQECYRNMFTECTKLTSAPALPATTLAGWCYYHMFSWCPNLTSAPALPATTLAGHCYQYMFAGCRNLTSAPALPATTLAEDCYASMFLECTSLTSTPSLPATTLAVRCYEWMFYDCTSLTSVPALPATTLPESCYGGMFSGCTGIRISEEPGIFNGITYGIEYRIPSAGTGTASQDSLMSMFYDTDGELTTPEINTTYYLKGGSVQSTTPKKTEADKAAAEKAADKATGGKTAADKVTEGKTTPKKTPADKAAAEKITIQKTPSSVKAKAKKNKVTVSWKKIKKNKAGKKLLKQIKSIQVQYSTDKTFKKNVKTKTVGKKKTKIKLKLQKKTTYYVRVRYKGSNGFSKWSKEKRFKTKK